MKIKKTSSQLNTELGAKQLLATYPEPVQSATMFASWQLLTRNHVEVIGAIRVGNDIYRVRVRKGQGCVTVQRSPNEAILHDQRAVVNQLVMECGNLQQSIQPDPEIYSAMRAEQDAKIRKQKLEDAAVRQNSTPSVLERRAQRIAETKEELKQKEALLEIERKKLAEIDAAQTMRSFDVKELWEGFDLSRGSVAAQPEQGEEDEDEGGEE